MAGVIDRIARKVGEGYERPDGDAAMPIDINYARLAEWLVRSMRPASHVQLQHSSTALQQAPMTSSQQEEAPHLIAPPTHRCSSAATCCRWIASKCRPTGTASCRQFRPRRPPHSKSCRLASWASLKVGPWDLGGLVRLDPWPGSGWFA